MSKICFFNTTRFLGGGEKKHLSYALELRERGHDIFMVVSPNSPLHRACLESEIQHMTVHLNGLSLFSKKKIRILRDFFIQNEIETVLFNGSNDVKAGGQAAFKAGVSKRIYWRGIALAPKNSWINRRVFRDYLTDVITNSEETKQLILKTMSQVFSPDHIHVVYNGIDFESFDHQRHQHVDLPEKGDKVILGNAARLTPQKNLEDMIIVAKALKERGRNFEMWIAGEGEQQEQIRHWIRRYDVADKVKMIGFITNVRAFMDEIDILVFPSLWEGFGFTLVEAMACSKPVVAYRVSSNPEIVDDGQTGILVEAGDQDEFVETVDRLVTNTELRESLGKNGYTYARDTFNLWRSVDRFEELVTSGG